MTFEEQVQALCREVVACESEPEATELARRMQVLMHRRIEELRRNLSGLPLLTETTPPE